METKIEVAIHNIKQKIKEADLEIRLKTKEKEVLRSQLDELEKLEGNKSLK